MNDTKMEKSEPAPSSSTAITKREADDMFRFGLEPDGFEQAMKLCETISNTGMFSGNKDGSPAKPALLLVRLMTGRSLGFPAITSLMYIYDVYGRPAIAARAKVALTLRHPECEQMEIVQA